MTDFASTGHFKDLMRLGRRLTFAFERIAGIDESETPPALERLAAAAERIAAALEAQSQRLTERQAALIMAEQGGPLSAEQQAEFDARYPPP